MNKIKHNFFLETFLNIFYSFKIKTLIWNKHLRYFPTRGNNWHIFIRMTFVYCIVSIIFYLRSLKAISDKFKYYANMKRDLNFVYVFSRIKANKCSEANRKLIINI